MTVLSIVTATLNARFNIEEQLLDYSKSPLSNDIEWIIHDSANSEDNLTSLSHPYNVHIFHEQDTGIYDALNQGISKACGDWILVLGSDDRINILQLSSLITQLKKICLNTIVLLDYQICYSSYDSKVSPPPLTRSSFIRGMPISHQCMVSPRHLLLKKPYSLKYQYAADMEWLLYHFLEDTSFTYISSSTFFRFARPEPL